MAVSQTTRIPPGGSVERMPGRFLKNSSLEDTVASIDKLVPAWFLPIIGKSYNKQVPFVMYPGTFVGTLNARDHSALITKFGSQSPNIMVPASAAATYTVVYSAYDLATDEFGGTYDIDSANGEDLVAATGAGASTIATVQPLGMVQEPILAQQYYRKYRNLQQQTKINLLVAGKVFRFGAITANEKLIYPGDLVCIEDTAGAWDPLGAPTTSYPGRVRKFDPTEADCAQIPFIVGRCVQRFPIITQTTPSTGSLLLTDILTSGALDASTLNQDQDFHIMKRIQTVPGLGLQGSATGGIPSDLAFARSDASGVYWGLDIQIGF